MALTYNTQLTDAGQKQSGKIKNPAVENAVNSLLRPTVVNQYGGTTLSNALVNGKTSAPASVTGSTNKVNTVTTNGTASGGTGSASGGGTDISPLVSMYQNMLAQQQAARQAAYNTSVAQQKKNHEYSVGQVNAAADKALQDAYINKMLAKRTMGQELSAQGLGGGMTETSMANLLNSYNNSRLGTENNRAAQIANLGNTYANNVAAAQNILHSGNAADMAQYATNLANLAAVNGTAGLNMTQGQAANANNPLYYAYLQQLMERVQQ